MLDNAIPEHLQCERVNPAKPNWPSGGFQPPYPSYSARFPNRATELVMAVIGLQYKSMDGVDGVAQGKVSSFLVSDSSTPTFSEWASVTDNRGFYNLAAFAYWPSTLDYNAWAQGSGFQAWWQSLQARDYHHGWFLEVFHPPIDRLETLFNTTTAEGSSHLREDWTGEIREHGYWGSMRDRLPLSQTDKLVGHKMKTNHTNTSTSTGGRIRVRGQRNLAVIRSGQDWLATTSEERELYLSTMHPVLEKGMNFLRDQGAEVDCYSCRFMDIVDPVTRQPNKDRTFGLAYFSDLASLESWCKEHPTHLAIFGGFHQYAKKLKNNVGLRVFHEVMVLEPDQQFFEYIGCHSGTGMIQANASI